MVVVNLIPGKLNVICICRCLFTVFECEGYFFRSFILSDKRCCHLCGQLSVNPAVFRVENDGIRVKAVGDVALGSGGCAVLHRVCNMRVFRAARCFCSAALIALAPILPDEAADSDVEACTLDEVKDCVNIAHCSKELRERVDNEVDHVILKEVLVDYRLNKLPESVAGGVVIVNRKLKHALVNKSGKNVRNRLLDNIVNVSDCVFNILLGELVGGLRPVIALVVNAVFVPGNVLHFIGDFFIDFIHDLIEVVVL